MRSRSLAVIVGRGSSAFSTTAAGFTIAFGLADFVVLFVDFGADVRVAFLATFLVDFFTAFLAVDFFFDAPVPRAVFLAVAVMTDLQAEPVGSRIVVAAV